MSTWAVPRRGFELAASQSEDEEEEEEKGEEQEETEEKQSEEYDVKEAPGGSDSEGSTSVTVVDEWSDSSDDSDADIQGRICDGQRALQQLRRSLRTTMVTVALVLTFVYQACVEKIVAEARRGTFCRTSIASHSVAFFANAAFCTRHVCLGLAPLADDLNITRLVAALDIIALTVVIAHLTSILIDHSSFPREFIFAIPADLVLLLVYLIGLVRAFLQKDSVTMQQHLWDALGWFMALSLLLSIPGCAMVTLRCHGIPATLWRIVFLVPTLIFTRHARGRQRVQALLHRMFLLRSAGRSAAGIAGLVGNCSAREAAALARARFRAILVSDLTFEDIADNSPDPELFARSSPCKLRCCDAFLSHSWHDDAPAKWSALQRWRRNFVARRGREPKIWFDKCCIDQNNIEADLRCLPIFLSGCRSLVVICGTTYLSRLWCIMELFTFVHMGGSIERIRLLMAPRGDDDEEELDSIESSFAAFNAANCQCFDPGDKMRMLRIIKAAFGDLEEFNRAVRKIFFNAGQMSWDDLTPMTQNGSGDVEATCTGDHSDRQGS